MCFTKKSFTREGIFFSVQEYIEVCNVGVFKGKLMLNYKIKECFD